MFISSDILSTKEVTYGNRIAPRQFKSSILNWNQLDILWEWIPERIYVQEPLVAFCSDVNGIFKKKVLMSQMIFTLII